MWRPVSLFVGVMAALAAGAHCRQWAPGEARVACCIPLRGRVDEFLVQSFNERVREAARLPAPSKEGTPPSRFSSISRRPAARSPWP